MSNIGEHWIKDKNLYSKMESNTFGLVYKTKIKDKSKSGINRHISFELYNV